MKVGNGELLNSDGLSEEIIEVPERFLSNESLITDIFGDILTPQNASSFSKMAILCPKNSDVDKVNEEVLYILEGQVRTYLSSDSIDDQTGEDEQNYPIEFYVSFMLRIM